MIAIILPCHNSMPHLQAAIEALYNSTNFPFKLILVESESTDGTVEYCNKLAKEKDNVEVYHTPKNGLPAAINYGINKAEDLDVYLTQDDVIHFRLYGRDWLAEMNEASKQNKETAMITSLDGFGISGVDYRKGMKWVGTWSCYLPRRTINKIGLFDENMGPGDDIDYSYRCLRAGKRFMIVPFWAQHHRMTEHGNVDNKDIIKKMGQYFKRKYNIK